MQKIQIKIYKYTNLLHIIYIYTKYILHTKLYYIVPINL